MGGSSTNFPDLGITNNVLDMMITVEAKNGTQDYENVPDDEIRRCFDMCRMLERYRKKYIIFGFKFMKKGRDRKAKTMIWRKLREYYLVIDVARPERFIDTITCSYSNGIKYTIFKEEGDYNDIIDITSRENLKAYLLQHEKQLTLVR